MKISKSRKILVTDLLLARSCSGDQEIELLLIGRYEGGEE